MRVCASLIIGVTFLFLPVVVFAGINTSVDPCAFVDVGGTWCDSQATTNPTDDVIENLAVSFVAIAISYATLFTIVGGGLLLISVGDDTRVSQGKKAILYSIVGLGLVLLAQTIMAYFTEMFSTLDESIGQTGGLPVTFKAVNLATNAVVNAFNAVFMVIMVWAGYRVTFGRGGNEEFNKAKSMLMWAIIGAITVNLAYAIIGVIISILPT